MFKFKTVRGPDVPEEAKKLTRGWDGTLLGWLYNKRDHMVAVLVYQNDDLIGWCAAVRSRTKSHWLWGPWRYTEKVQIGTFVADKFRGKGLGKRLLRKMTWVLHITDPRTIVQYGAPEDDAGFFNKTYDKTIKEGGLTADRYYCVPD